MIILRQKEFKSDEYYKTLDDLEKAIDSGDEQTIKNIKKAVKKKAGKKALMQGLVDIPLGALSGVAAGGTSGLAIDATLLNNEECSATKKLAKMGAILGAAGGLGSTLGKFSARDHEFKKMEDEIRDRKHLKKYLNEGIEPSKKDIELMNEWNDVVNKYHSGKEYKLNPETAKKIRKITKGADITEKIINGSK